MPYLSDAAFFADIFFPLKLAGGILLGYVMFEFWQSKMWPPDDPDAWT